MTKRSLSFIIIFVLLLSCTEQTVDQDQNDKNIEGFYILQGLYIDAALEEAIKEYGSMDNFIREGLGITENEITMLKEFYLE